MTTVCGCLFSDWEAPWPQFWNRFELNFCTLFLDCFFFKPFLWEKSLQACVAGTKQTGHFETGISHGISVMAKYISCPCTDWKLSHCTVLAILALTFYETKDRIHSKKIRLRVYNCRQNYTLHRLTARKRNSELSGHRLLAEIVSEKD